MLSHRYNFLYLFLIRRNLISRYNIANIHEVTKIKKIVLSLNFEKEDLEEKKIFMGLFFLFLISNGLKGNIIYSKLKKPLGCKLDLITSSSIFYFLERFCLFSIYNIRNFNMFSFKSFSNSGTFDVKIKDLSIFPEIEDDFENFSFLKNLNISIIFSKKNKYENFNLLSSFLLPFKKVS